MITLRANIYEPLDTAMVILQLCCWKFSHKKRGWVTLSANFRRKGRRPPSPPITVGVCKPDQSDCPFVWYQNIGSALFGFVTKHACERRTDGRTELRQLIPRYFAR